MTLALPIRSVSAAVLATEPLRIFRARGEAALAEAIGVTECRARLYLAGVAALTVAQAIAAALTVDLAWDAVFVGVSECLSHEQVGADAQGSA